MLEIVSYWSQMLSFIFYFYRNSTVGLPPPCLHGTADDKARLFRERYTILQQVCKNCNTVTGKYRYIYVVIIYLWVYTFGFDKLINLKVTEY